MFYFNLLLYFHGINLNMYLVGVKKNPSSFFSPKLGIDPDCIIFIAINKLLLKSIYLDMPV